MSARAKQSAQRPAAGEHRSGARRTSALREHVTSAFVEFGPVWFFLCAHLDAFLFALGAVCARWYLCPITLRRSRTPSATRLAWQASITESRRLTLTRRTARLMEQPCACESRQLSLLTGVSRFRRAGGARLTSTGIARTAIIETSQSKSANKPHHMHSSVPAASLASPCPLELATFDVLIVARLWDRPAPGPSLQPARGDQQPKQTQREGRAAIAAQRRERRERVTHTNCSRTRAKSARVPLCVAAPVREVGVVD